MATPIDNLLGSIASFDPYNPAFDPRSYRRRVRVPERQPIGKLPLREAGFWTAWKDSRLRADEYLAAKEYAANPNDTTMEALAKVSEPTYAYLSSDEVLKNPLLAWKFLRQQAGQAFGFMTNPIVASAAASFIPVPGSGPVAFMTTGTASYTTSYLIRKAQENQRLISEGKMADHDLDLDTMLGSGFASAGLDLFGLRLLKAIGAAAGLAGRDAQKQFFKTVLNSPKLNPNAGILGEGIPSKGLAAKTLKGRLGKGAAAAAAFEAPQEMIQTILERNAVGLSLTDEEAQREIIEAGILGSILGAPLGAISNFNNRVEQQETQPPQPLLLGAPPEPSPPTVRNLRTYEVTPQKQLTGFPKIPSPEQIDEKLGVKEIDMGPAVEVDPTTPPLPDLRSAPFGTNIMYADAEGNVRPYGPNFEAEYPEYDDRIPPIQADTKVVGEAKGRITQLRTQLDQAEKASLDKQDLIERNRTQVAILKFVKSKLGKKMIRAPKRLQGRLSQIKAAAEQFKDKFAIDNEIERLEAAIKVVNQEEDRINNEIRNQLDIIKANRGRVGLITTGAPITERISKVVGAPLRGEDAGRLREEQLTNEAARSIVQMVGDTPYAGSKSNRYIRDLISFFGIPTSFIESVEAGKKRDESLGRNADIDKDTKNKNADKREVNNYAETRNDNLAKDTVSRRERVAAENANYEEFRGLPVEEQLIKAYLPTFSEADMLQFRDLSNFGAIDWNRVTEESKKRWLEANIRFIEKENRRPITPKELETLETEIGQEYSDLVDMLVPGTTEDIRKTSGKPDPASEKLQAQLSASNTFNEEWKANFKASTASLPIGARERLYQALVKENKRALARRTKTDKKAPYITLEEKVENLYDYKNPLLFASEVPISAEKIADFYNLDVRIPEDRQILTDLIKTQRATITARKKNRRRQLDAAYRDEKKRLGVNKLTSVQKESIKRNLPVILETEAQRRVDEELEGVKTGPTARPVSQRDKAKAGPVTITNPETTEQITFIPPKTSRSRPRVIEPDGKKRIATLDETNIYNEGIRAREFEDANVEDVSVEDIDYNAFTNYVDDIPLSSDDIKGRSIDGITSERIIANDLKSALRQISKEVGGVMGRIANRLSALGLKTSIVYGRVTDPITGARKEGQYDPTTDTITLDPEYGANVHTLLHEVTHAATQNALKRGGKNPIVRQLNELYKFSKNYIDGDVFPDAAQSLEEFVAEVFANPQLQNRLKEISYKQKRRYSLWERFINAVKRILRLPTESVFDQAYNSINKILEVPDIDPEGTTLYRMGIFSNNTYKDNVATSMFKKFDKNSKIGRDQSSTSPDTILSLLLNSGAPVRKLVSGFMPLSFLNKMAQRVFSPEVREMSDQLVKLIKDKSRYLLETKKAFSPIVMAAYKLRSKDVKKFDAFRDIVNESTFNETKIANDADGSPLTKEQFEEAKAKWNSKQIAGDIIDTAYKKEEQRLGRSLTETERKTIRSAELQKVFKEWDKLYARYTNLEKPYQEMYGKMRRAYDAIYKELTNQLAPLIDRYVENPEANASIKRMIQQKIIQRQNIDPYFALSRFGEHKLFYIDPVSKEKVVEFFESPKARDAVIDQVKIDILDTAGFKSDADMGRRLLDFDNERRKYGINITLDLEDATAKYGNNPDRLNTYNTLMEEYKRFDEKAKRVLEELGDITPFNKMDIRNGGDLGNIPDDAFIKKIMGFVDNDDSNLSREEKNQFYETIIEAMPEFLITGNMRTRSSVRGYSKDIIRSLATYGDNHIRMAANLKYNRDILSTSNNIESVINNVRKEGNTDKFDFEFGVDIAQDFSTSLQNRAKFAANHTSFNAITRGFTATSFHWMMGFNMSSALIQLTQLPMVVYPMLGGEYGFLEAGKSIGKATRMVMGSGKLLSDSELNLYKKDGKSFKYWGYKRKDKDLIGDDYVDDAIPSILNYSREQVNYLQANTQQRKALEKEFAGNRNVLESFKKVPSTLEFTKKDAATGKQVAYSKNDFNDLIDALKYREIGRSATYEYMELGRNSAEDYGPYKRTMAQTMAASATAFNAADQFSREVTAIAAFDLEMKESGNKTLAIQKAANALEEYHGPAASETTSGIAQNNLGRILTIFKQYGMAMYSLLFSSMYRALPRGWTGGRVDPRDAAIARRQVAGLYGGSYLFGGVQGMPFFFIPEFIHDMFFRDDGEDDFETKTRMFFGEAPIDRLLGVSVSTRASFGDLIVRDSREDIRTATGLMEEALIQIGGAPFSIVSQFAKGADEIAEGNVLRGLESAIPVSTRNLMKSLRYAREGARTTRGDIILGDVPASTLVATALGLSDKDLMMQLEKNNWLIQKRNVLQKKQQKLLHALHLARKNYDTQSYAEIYKEIFEFAEKHPELNITGKKIQASLKRRQKNSEIAELYGGMILDKKYRTAFTDRYNDWDVGINTWDDPLYD